MRLTLGKLGLKLITKRTNLCLFLLLVIGSNFYESLWNKEILYPFWNLIRFLFRIYFIKKAKGGISVRFKLKRNIKRSSLFTVGGMNSIDGAN